MFPIWGEYIHRIVSSELDREMKESGCLMMIESLMTNPKILDTHWKLYEYVSNICFQTKKAGPVGMVSGKFIDIVFSTLIVKRYVTIDLHNPDSNLIVWTWTCARHVAPSLVQTLYRIHRRTLDAQ